MEYTKLEDLKGYVRRGPKAYVSGELVGGVLEYTPIKVPVGGQLVVESSMVDTTVDWFKELLRRQRILPGEAELHVDEERDYANVAFSAEVSESDARMESILRTLDDHRAGWCSHWEHKPENPDERTGRRVVTLKSPGYRWLR